jgi:hypothetical protein
MPRHPDQHYRDLEASQPPDWTAAAPMDANRAIVESRPITERTTPMDIDTAAARRLLKAVADRRGVTLPAEPSMSAAQTARMDHEGERLGFIGALQQWQAERTQQEAARRRADAERE